MKPLKILATLLNRFIWLVGLMTLMNYLFAHWPAAFQTGLCASLLAFGIWYFWKFFLQPFRAGLKGE